MWCDVCYHLLWVIWWRCYILYNRYCQIYNYLLIVISSSYGQTPQTNHTQHQNHFKLLCYAWEFPYVKITGNIKNRKNSNHFLCKNGNITKVSQAVVQKNICRVFLSQRIWNYTRKYKQVFHRNVAMRWSCWKESWEKTHLHFHAVMVHIYFKQLKQIE